MAETPKFKGNLQPRDQDYGHAGVSFFGDDKADLIEVLNKAKLPYSSLTHFIRAAINDKLKQLGIDFHITER